MSKSLSRVRAALRDAGQDDTIREVAQARTAQEAADAVGCQPDQIAKSIIFRAASSDSLVLFLTAGGQQVDPDKASDLAGEPLGRADAEVIRARTGFAIGGVAPLAHMTPLRTWCDPRLHDFDLIWAAAGTPRHVFSIRPDILVTLTGATMADFTR